MKVYKYGLLAPTVGAVLVDEQLRASHRYYNTLIEIERWRRSEVRAAQSERVEIEALEAWRSALVDDLAAAREEIKKQRASTRSRSDTAKQRECASVLLGMLREASALLREAKADLRADVDLRKRYDAISSAANDRVKSARASCGCYWGTYLLIEQAAEAARRDAISEPRFRRFDGSGAVAVQLQHGLLASSALGCEDARLQIDERPQGCGSGKSRPRVRLRVGSEGRDPIWAEWPLVLHRPLPPGAVISWAAVRRERLGGKDRWSLHITLATPAQGPCTYDMGGGSGVAVDIGWRRMADGALRVAYMIDTAGDHEQVCVEPAVLARLQKVDDLRSIRDRHLDVLRQRLVEWRREHVDTLPEWLREATATMAQWKSPARFAALALRWRGTPVTEHEDVREIFEEWRKKDKHLWTWEANLRDKVLRRRREQYRVLAADLARRYRTLVVERFDLRDVQERQPPESEKVDRDAAHAQQQLAAVSILRDCLKSAFAARGGIVVELPAPHTTHDCAACGSREVWNQVDELVHRCVKCGSVWDQDANSAKNLLATWREGRGAAQFPDGARVTDHGAPIAKTGERQSKWGKRGRHAKGRSQDGAEEPEIVA